LVRPDDLKIVALVHVDLVTDREDFAR